MATLFQDLVTMSLLGAERGTCVRSNASSAGMERESAQLFIHVQKETWNLSCTMPTGSLLSNTFQTDFIILKSIILCLSPFQKLYLRLRIDANACFLYLQIPQDLTYSLTLTVFRDRGSLKSSPQTACIHRQEPSR